SLVVLKSKYGFCQATLTPFVFDEMTFSCSFTCVPSTALNGFHTLPVPGSKTPCVGSNPGQLAWPIPRVNSVELAPSAGRFPAKLPVNGCPPNSHCSGGGPGFSGTALSSSPQHWKICRKFCATLDEGVAPVHVTETAWFVRLVVWFTETWRPLKGPRPDTVTA